MRDIVKEPYTKEEARVAEYICEYGIGGGDDPIGWLIASHRLIAAERREHLERDGRVFKL